MPRKNVIKIYYRNGFFHIYNRGVDKRNIFEEENDYAYFLHLLKESLLSPEDLDSEREEKAKLQGFALQKKIFHKRKNYFGKINLLCYCLMPNHFHLLTQQISDEPVGHFVHSLSTAYSMYFNKKYERSGILYQGPFRAVDVDNENYFLWLSRYIHRNPINFINYQFSSYQDYLNKRKTKWLYKNTIFSLFPETESKLQGKALQPWQKYSNFVQSDNQQTVFEDLTLESE